MFLHPLGLQLHATENVLWCYWTEMLYRWAMGYELWAMALESKVWIATQLWPPLTKMSPVSFFFFNELIIANCNSILGPHKSKRSYVTKGVRMRLMGEHHKKTNDGPGRNIILFYPICFQSPLRSARHGKTIERIDWTSPLISSGCKCAVETVQHSVSLHFFPPKRNVFSSSFSFLRRERVTHFKAKIACTVHWILRGWYTKCSQITFTITKYTIRKKNMEKQELWWFDGISYYFHKRYVALLSAPICYD